MKAIAVVGFGIASLAAIGALAWGPLAQHGRTTRRRWGRPGESDPVYDEVGIGA